MTTATAPTTGWNTVTFAVLAARPYPSLDRPTYNPTGHSTDACPAINGKVIATEASLADHLERNEWFDGEVAFLDVWPCGTCVSVKGGTPTTIGFEAPLPAFGTGTGQARPAVEVEADPREAEARTYAAAYTGTFEFMVSMREKAQRRSSTLTPKMVDAILRCKAADARRNTPAAPAADAPQSDEDARRATLRPNAYAGTCRGCKGDVAANAGRREQIAGRWTVLHSTTAECAAATPVATPEAPATVTPDVPAGHYAVETDEGHLAFYNVDRPTEGRWAGRTFLSVQASDEYHAIRGRAAADAILAKIAVDPQAAMLRYGQEIGRCGHCNRTLTDETSRALGIGPICRGRMDF